MPMMTDPMMRTALGMVTLVAGSPVKLSFWVGNRVATWSGLVVLWRRLKGLPDRTKRFLLWGAAINAVSISLLFGIFKVFRVQ